MRMNDGNPEMAQISIDSCEVVHGKFNFIGFIDSIMMVELCMDEECMMPVVLENAEHEIHMDHAGHRVSGGPLNERLYNFFKKRDRLENELWEVQQQYIRMIRKGKSAEEIHEKTASRRERLSPEIVALETHIRYDNYNNVLGPGFFLFLAGQYQRPIITPQMRTILQDAPPVFMEHPCIVRFVNSVEQ